jgi:hypothetical protein
MRRMNSSRLAAVTAGLYGIIALALTSSATAETTAQIDAGVKAARDQCAAQIPGCNEAALVDAAFPRHSERRPNDTA